MKFISLTVFNSVSDMARNVISEPTFIPNYNVKIVIGECVLDGGIKPIHVVRAWKNENYFSFDKNPFEKHKSIGSLDYSVNEKIFKIEFLHVFDNDDCGFDADPKYVDAVEYIKSMISIAERKALESNHDKIIMDTHKSLRLFHRYYKDADFVLTNNVSSDHSAWVETQKNIKK